VGGPWVGLRAVGFVHEKIVFPSFCDGIAFNRPGSDLLSRVLRRSTIGAGAFHGRVRNGNGCGRPAMTTRSIKGNVLEKLVQFSLLFLTRLWSDNPDKCLAFAGPAAKACALLYRDKHCVFALR
jgi:hypothetical protein